MAIGLTVRDTEFQAATSPRKVAMSPVTTQPQTHAVPPAGDDDPLWFKDAVIYQPLTTPEESP